jgi:transcriptional regulator with XRE-family HTH domain
MTHIERPAPVGVTERGAPRYDPREVRAYRLVHGVTQAEVAGLLRFSQSMVALYEGDEGKLVLGEEAVNRMADAVDRAAARREKLILEGAAAYEALLAESKADRNARLSAPRKTGIRSRAEAARRLRETGRESEVRS